MPEKFKIGDPEKFKVGDYVKRVYYTNVTDISYGVVVAQLDASQSNYFIQFLDQGTFTFSGYSLIRVSKEEYEAAQVVDA